MAARFKAPCLRSQPTALAQQPFSPTSRLQPWSGVRYGIGKLVDDYKFRSMKASLKYFFLMLWKYAPYLIIVEVYTISAGLSSLPSAPKGFPIFIVASVRAQVIQSDASASSRPGQTLIDMCQVRGNSDSDLCPKT